VEEVKERAICQRTSHNNPGSLSSWGEGWGEGRHLKFKHNIHHNKYKVHYFSTTSFKMPIFKQ